MQGRGTQKQKHNHDSWMTMQKGKDIEPTVPTMLRCHSRCPLPLPPSLPPALPPLLPPLLPQFLTLLPPQVLCAATIAAHSRCHHRCHHFCHHRCHHSGTMVVSVKVLKGQGRPHQSAQQQVCRGFWRYLSRGSNYTTSSRHVSTTAAPGYP